MSEHTPPASPPVGYETTEPPHPAPMPRRGGRAGTVALGVGVVVVLALQAVLAVGLLRTSGDVAEIGDRLDEVQGSVDEAVASFEAAEAAAVERLEQFTAPAASEAPEQLSQAPETALTAGALPPLPQDGSDPAVTQGLVLGPVSGTEWYGQTQLSIAPDDGVARAWLVWAHWCPYCQEELPVVSAWHDENAAGLPHFEVVSITTAMSPEADNPLEPYLESSAFPFPVLMDPSGALSSQLGVTAFPFWVFTGPDGRVLGRTAGLLPDSEMERIFGILAQEGATAAS